MTDPASSHAESSGLRSLLRGLWLPLVTPFCDGIVDEVSLRRLVRHYAKLPIDGLILAATSGEGLTLGMAELEWIVAVTRDVITEGKRYLPICLGLAGSHTRKMCHTLDETAGWPAPQEVDRLRAVGAAILHADECWGGGRVRAACRSRG